MKPIDFTKPITTRDGRKVRILCTDGPNEVFPVVGSIEGAKNIFVWREDGTFDEWDENAKLDCDLINPPIKRKVEFWVNVFDIPVNVFGDEFMSWQDKERADRLGKDRIACLHFTREYEEGEGL